MPRAVGDRSILTPEIMAHYRSAQPSPAALAASAALPGYILGASDWLRLDLAGPRRLRGQAGAHSLGPEGHRIPAEGTGAMDVRASGGRDSRVRGLRALPGGGGAWKPRGGASQLPESSSRRRYAVDPWFADRHDRRLPRRRHRRPPRRLPHRLRPDLKQTTYGATLGTVASWCSHPNKIPLANDVFAPSPKDIKQAQKMVDPYNESVAKGAGAGGRGGQLVDAATPRITQRVHGQRST